MPWEWDKGEGKRVFRPPTDDEVRANLIAANERYQDQIDRARAALEEMIADRDRLAAENAELRAGQQTAYENLVKVAKRAKASAARVRELEAALWEMLSHYAPDPDDDTEAAVSAYAVLGEQAGSEEAF